MFSKKRRDWLNVFNTPCALVQFEPADDCPNAFQIPLIEQNFIEAHNSDSLLVKRILGDLNLAVVGFADVTAIAFQANMMRLALKRWETPGGAQNPPIYNPMLGDDIQLDPGGDDQGDFSEMRAVHEWSHFFESDETLVEDYTQIPVWKPRLEDCAGITGEFCVVPEALTDGSGHTWNSGPGASGHLPLKLGGTLDCNPCGEIGSPTVGFHLKAPPSWRLHIDLKFRKGIRLHENQALTLFGGWENLDIGQGRQVQQTVVCFGGLRVLIET